MFPRAALWGHLELQWKAGGQEVLSAEIYHRIQAPVYDTKALLWKSEEGVEFHRQCNTTGKVPSLNSPPPMYLQKGKAPREEPLIKDLNQ